MQPTSSAPVTRTYLNTRILTLFAGMLALLWIASGCSSDDGGPSGLLGQGPTQIAIVSGNAQVGFVGTQLALPIVFLVTDTNGTPLSGVPVQFIPTQGTATYSTFNGTTDVNGNVQLFLTPGAAGNIAGKILSPGLVTQPPVFTATAS
jgi:hypothetical protein